MPLCHRVFKPLLITWEADPAIHPPHMTANMTVILRSVCVSLGARPTLSIPRTNAAYLEACQGENKAANPKILLIKSTVLKPTSLVPGVFHHPTLARLPLRGKTAEVVSSSSPHGFHFGISLRLDH